MRLNHRWLEIGLATTCAALVWTPTRARAADDEGEGEEKPWIERHAPRPMMGEVGVFGGVVLPGAGLELFGPREGEPDQGYRPLRRVAADFGARAAFLPSRFFGFEIEGAVMPNRVDDDAASRATMWAFRGHLVGQIGLWSVTPFAVLGATAMGVASDPNQGVGNDVDASIHFGGGLKVWVADHVALRLDLRDTVSAKRGVDNGVTHTGEILLGVSYTFGGRSEPEKGPRDTDGDGFLDDEDLCPAVPGVAPDGCPRGDRDSDGFYDDVDACPDEPGIEPDGCPRPDRDHDLIADDEDQCPDDPETRNGYQDGDGCPDELPEEVEAFSGVIEGIEFDLNRATIRPRSKPILDLAAETLRKYAEVRVEIGGHTDSTGSRDYNLELSRRRARVVKNYLISRGVDPGQLEARGYGPDRPIDTNDTPDGRARNRRVEFVIMQ